MAAVYSEGPMAQIVAAAGRPGLMNLGWAPPQAYGISVGCRQENLVRLVQDALELKGNETVLDLGCGRGGTLRILADSMPSLKVVGLNVDSRQLAGAKEILELVGSRAWLIGADAATIPLCASSVDVSCAVEVTAHLRDREILAAEVRRVLKPGGQLVLAAITLNRPLRALRADEVRHIERVAAYFDERPEDYGTLVDLEAVFSVQGFRLRCHRDLTDGVFTHRHSDMIAELARLKAGSLWQRLSRFYRYRVLWKVDEERLREFLEAHTARHACRYFEYHLLVFESRLP